MTHTGGKWYVTGSNPPHIYSHDGMSIIAQCDSAGEMKREQEKANAQLISAAPDLLAALEKIVAHLSPFMGQGNMDDDIKQARAAINKAKGL